MGGGHWEVPQASIAVEEDVIGTSERLHLEKPLVCVGGCLCDCVSAPYLFSRPLILVPPAAPHTKPHSPNPQGVGKGGQLHSSAPWGPMTLLHPCVMAPAPPALLWTRPAVSTWKDFRLLFPSKSGPVFSTFWFLVVDTPRQVP